MEGIQLFVLYRGGRKEVLDLGDLRRFFDAFQEVPCGYDIRSGGLKNVALPLEVFLEVAMKIGPPSACATGPDIELSFRVGAAGTTRLFKEYG